MEIIQLPYTVFRQTSLTTLQALGCAFFVFILALTSKFSGLFKRFKGVSCTIPCTLPVLKNTIPFAFDGLNFLRSAR